VYYPPREEGWLRHQENFGKAHVGAADGVVAHEPCAVRATTPAAVAATPPHEEGNIGMLCPTLNPVRTVH